MAAARLAAQTGGVVGAQCTIEAPSLINLYGEAKTKEISAGLCKAVVEELSRHQIFGTWRYVIDAAAAPATLALRVEDGRAEDTFLILEFRQGDFRKKWLAVWRRPGDRQIADPLAGEAADVLTRDFVALVLEANAREIEEKLKTVPIATARWLKVDGSNAPRIVSSLPWESYQHLRSSVFKVRCRWDAKDDDVSLESRGVVVPARFEPGGNLQPYDALVVVVNYRDYGNQHTPVEQVLDEMSQLKPKTVYFIRYEDPDLDLFKP
jgi:hypothetical protein